MKKGMAWWNDDVRYVVKFKKDLYRKALNEKTDEAWEKYKEGNKEVKSVVREAKERDWIK